jgi:branched-chain amino acid aminotransferase
MTTVWVDGRLRDPDEPSVSALDHGLTVGDGVFETLKVVKGEPFALSRHLDRLVRSARGLGLPAPDLDVVRAGCRAVLEQLPPDAAHRLRITCTAGPGPLGSDRTAGRATVVVAASPTAAWPEGASVAVAPWPRNERGPLVGLKTTSYADNVVALQWAHERGADEALLLNTAGQLCEGTGSNVFVVLDGQVLTPWTASGCLAGITRDLVLEWTDAQQDNLGPESLHRAEEVFLTSSTRDVQAVTRIDGRVLPIGPRTRAIQQVFAERSARDLDP